jgi:hypothetical protein
MILESLGDLPMGAIMYGLANIDFSNPLGAVISQSLTDDFDGQQQAESDPETASPPARDYLAMAVFGAA